jgi:hypothetical protein
MWIQLKNDLIFMPTHLKRHSTDNQQNGSLSFRPQRASTVDNNLPLEEAGSSIYHYDKQPFSDEQQKHEESSSVEHELRNFDGIKISDCEKDDKDAEATRIMTYECEIKTNNSFAEGISVDNEVGGGEGERKKTINNINDDKNLSTTAASSTVALNDKIGEIYRKIERIEGDYYGEKEKIIEKFERKSSTSSMSGDAAKLETQSMIDSGNGKYDAAEIEASQFDGENVQQEPNQKPPEMENVENAIYENDGSDQHQSEIVENWSESKSHEMEQPNYNYTENQQNPEFLQTTDEYPGEGQGQFQNENQPFESQQAVPRDVQYDQYSYEQTQQPYTDDPHQQQTEFVYSHHDENTQQQQEANNYNPSFNTQSDSNYQQNNYDEAQENPSNYTNDSAGVYYDYDQNQQQQQEQLETAPQIMYDDQNYTHQQPAEYQSNVEVEASQHFYENVDSKIRMMNQGFTIKSNYGI